MTESNKHDPSVQALLKATMVDGKSLVYNLLAADVLARRGEKGPLARTVLQQAGATRGLPGEPPHGSKRETK